MGHKVDSDVQRPPQRKRKRDPEDRAADAERERREEFMRRATLDTLLLTKGEQRGKARRDEEQRLRRMQVRRSCHRLRGSAEDAYFVCVAQK